MTANTSSQETSHIPAAEAFADRKAARSDPLWTTVFCHKMNELMNSESGNGSDNKAARVSLSTLLLGAL
jgi:hypothetical protein